MVAESSNHTMSKKSKRKQTSFNLSDLDNCFLFQKNQMLYAINVHCVLNPSIHDFRILLSQSQVSMDSFCIVKVTPVGRSEGKFSASQSTLVALQEPRLLEKVAEPNAVTTTGGVSS